MTLVVPDLDSNTKIRLGKPLDGPGDSKGVKLGQRSIGSKQHMAESLRMEEKRALELPLEKTHSLAIPLPPTDPDGEEERISAHQVRFTEDIQRQSTTRNIVERGL